MLNRTLLYVDDLDELAGIKNPDANISVLHLIDLQNPGRILELVSYYYRSQPRLSFCIFLKHFSCSEKNAYDLGLLLAHPMYMRQNKSVVIFIDDADAAPVHGFLRKQGYQNSNAISLRETHFHTAPLTAVHISSREQLPVQEDEFRDYYHDYLRKGFNQDDLFIICRKRANLPETIVKLKNIQLEFEAEQPYLAALLKNLSSLKNENVRLLAKTSMQQKELETMHELFLLNAESKETEYILNFYQREYEVLPLWFKRLGHVIKAIQGKRTWKSLIKDDNR